MPFRQNINSSSSDKAPRLKSTPIVLLKITLVNMIMLMSQVGIGQQIIEPETSSVTFEITNMRFNTVEGSFSGMQGTIVFSPDDLENSNFDVCVEAASVNTGNQKRDEHLRKEDFFNVATYPLICFQSNEIVKTKSGNSAKGTLTMHGVTKEVSIPFTFTNNTFSGSIELDRTDYGVGSDGSFMVGKEVQLQIMCHLK